MNLYQCALPEDRCTTLSLSKIDQVQRSTASYVCHPFVT